MRRLRAMDAAFLYTETAAAPMHAAALQIFEPEASGEDFFTGGGVHNFNNFRHEDDSRAPTVRATMSVPPPGISVT